MKQARTASNFDEVCMPSPDYQDQPGMEVSIEGLTQIGQGRFMLHGVKPRTIDWQAVGEAVGFEPTDDEMVDALGNAIWHIDLRRILIERIKR
jgi:hypothetical protein